MMTCSSQTEARARWIPARSCIASVGGTSTKRGSDCGILMRAMCSPLASRTTTRD